jgi:hypothetical protein
VRLSRERDRQREREMKEWNNKVLSNLESFENILKSEEIKTFSAECLWLTPVILSTWESEIGRISGQIVIQTPSPK